MSASEREISADFWDEVKSCLDMLGLEYTLTQKRKIPNMESLQSAIEFLQRKRIRKKESPKQSLKQEAEWILETFHECFELMVEKGLIDSIVLSSDGSEEEEEEVSEYGDNRDAFFDWCMNNSECAVNMLYCSQLAACVEDKKQIANKQINDNTGIAKYISADRSSIRVELEMSRNMVIFVHNESIPVVDNEVCVNKVSIPVLQGKATVDGRLYAVENKNQIRAGDILRFQGFPWEPYVVVSADEPYVHDSTSETPLRQSVTLRNSCEPTLNRVLLQGGVPIIEVTRSIRDVFSAVKELIYYRPRSREECSHLCNIDSGFFDMSVIEYTLRHIFRFDVIVRFQVQDSIVERDDRNFVGCILNVDGNHYVCVSHAECPVFVEPQQGMMCGMHALNNLLQQKKICFERTSCLFTGCDKRIEQKKSIGDTFVLIDSLNPHQFEVDKAIPSKYHATSLDGALPKGRDIQKIIYVFRNQHSYIFNT